MQRIGFIGTENSHTDHFIRFLNTEGRHPGFRADALVGGDTERNRQLAEAGGIELIVDEPADLVGRVDAVIISTRDGARHREQADPLLAAGIPVLVDKPLATSVDDADAILAAAVDAGTFVYSASALRAVPQVRELADPPPSAGALRHLHIAGPADPDSSYSGLFFYGIHHVEAALEILGNPEIGALDVVVRRSDDTTVATMHVGDAAVTLTFVAPGDGRRTPFHGTAVHSNGIVARELVLDHDYNAPALATFVAALTAGRAPVAARKMRDPIAVLSAVTHALPERKDNP